MVQNVTQFTPYPFQLGERIRITAGNRHGDWEVIGLGEGKVTLRCPVSGREVSWPQFCYLVETIAQEWPQSENGSNEGQDRD